MFKSIRSKFGSKPITQDEMNGPYKRQTRSMDARINPFMSQPMLALQSDSTGPTDGHSSRTASSMSNSPIPLYSSPLSTWEPPVRLAKSESMPAKPRPNNNAAIVVTTNQVSARVRTSTGVPDIIVSESRIATEDIPHGHGQVAIPSADEALTPTQNASRATFNKPNGLPAAHASSNAPTSLSVVTSTSSKPRPITQSSRRPSVLQITDMPPSAFHISKGGSVRLSPSIITRPAPMPLLNLPKIPAPSSDLQSPPPKPQSRLRSMPALSVDGTNELDREADHDNSGMGDSDDEDESEEMHGGSDEEGDDDLAHSNSSHNHPSDPRATTASPLRPNLPLIDTAPFDLSFPTFKSPVAGPSVPPAAPRREGDVTPTAFSNTSDYFSVKSRAGPSETPRVGNTKSRPSTGHRTPGPRVISRPSSSSSRPTIYHQASKSMINLLSPKQELPPAKELDRKQSRGKGKARAQPDAPTPAPEYTEGTGLRRQRSMPIFNATSEPPPYPTFARRDNLAIMPRDDEGMERLPEYSNSIHLIATMPRKMEFSSPGVQAKDRKWRRTLCELQGTVFRVYKCPPGASGGAIGEWWEKKVGVGDVTTSNGSGSMAKDLSTNGTTTQRPSKLIPDSHAFSDVLIPSGSRTREPQPAPTHVASPVQKPRRLTASLLHPITRGGSSPGRSRSHGRSHSDAPMPSSETAPRSSLNITRATTRSSSQLNSSIVSSSNNSVAASNSSPNGSPPSSSSRSSFFPRPSGRNSAASFNRSSPILPYPDPSDLIRTYTLQNAESGLGNDYLKRKNVIRVRMEGEQFLLQAQDVAEVVEWIEALHAATNIALDLDERVMPKGPMFPRRRRRRRRPEPDGANSTPPADHPDQS